MDIEIGYWYRLTLKPELHIVNGRPGKLEWVQTAVIKIVDIVEGKYIGYQMAGCEPRSIDWFTFFGGWKIEKLPELENLLYNGKKI